MTKRSLILFITLLSITLFSCKFTDPELVYLEKFNVTKFTKESVEFEVLAKVNNPNNYKVSLVNTRLDIFINGEPMGKAKLLNKVHFKRKTTATYSIQLANKPENFAKLGVVSLFSMFGQKPLDIKVTGIVKGRVGLFTRKFDVEFTEKVRL